MNLLKVVALLIVPLGLLGCGGGSGDSEDFGPIPEQIEVSVSAPDDFDAQRGEEFSIGAIGEFTPFHPDIELTYSWSRLVFPKPFEEVLADFDGDALMAVLSLEGDSNFSTSRVIDDFMPELEAGGFVQYTVVIGAEGFQFDTSNVNPNSLTPTVSRFSDVVRVFVAE